MSNMANRSEKKSKKPPRILHGPPRELQPNISLGRYFIDGLRKHGTIELLINAATGYVVTNEEILQRTLKLANMLRKKGIGIGDRISIMSENHFDFLVVVSAVLCVGAVFVPYNPAYTEHEVSPLLNSTKPKIIFISKRTEKIILKITSNTSWPTEVISLDDEVTSKKVDTLKRILEKDPAYVDPDRFEAVSFEDNAKHPAVILCSSGTTGFPKGVQLSYRNILCLLTAQVGPQYSDIKKGDSFLLYLPFYHGYAFCVLIMCAVSGAQVVMMQSFKPDLFLSSIEKYRVTHLPLVPPILVFLAKHPDVPKYDFRSVRDVVCGAAALPKELIQEVKQRTGIKFIRNAYGMTELTVVACVSERNSEKTDSGVLTKLVPGLSCKIVNPDTQEILGPDEIGELCFKGDHVMFGYYENPKATTETIDRDGWLHTGDLGYYDENGGIYIVDRLKELIKYKAYQVSPVEIEQVLLSHPKVKDAAAAGIPDQNSGELPMAFVVKQPGAEVTAKQLMTYVSGKLSPQKWLRGGVRFVDAIPKNPTGKILRKELKLMISKL